MYLTNKKIEKEYTTLMNDIKCLNLDWINLRKSTDYKVGMALCRLTRDIKKFDFKDFSNAIKSWINGKKSNSMPSKSYKKVDLNNKEPNYFSSERIAIYTCIFGQYDSVIEPLIKPDNCDFYIFTDAEYDQKNSVWKKKDNPEKIANMDNIDKNRYIKMHPNEIFPEYKYSIYVDGNIKIISDLTEYVNLLNENGIGIHLHHLRNCVFDELHAVTKSKRIDKESAKKHEKYLIENGMPRNYGLLQCNVIVRDHNNPICIKIMNEWWKEFKKNSKRDQLSLPYVLYKNDIPVEKIGVLGTNVYRNPSFRILLHK